MKLRKNKKGFTLVELLVVIAIIGVLAVVAVPALFSNINKAKVASVESDYSSIKSAALSYYSDTNKMPATASVGDLTKLKTYMETLPDKADIGGAYQLLLGDNKLVLQIGKDSEKATLTGAQSTKLVSDIGGDKIYRTIANDGTLANQLKANEKVDNEILYIVLIDNAEMDSANN
ncbi:prepilin-type N-terminal cleavage/methylation domain-containing protein [Clostridioides sp. ES-S-0006-03]|uniref:type II secretion system protein n=1 Tax=Clostridioides sp. ES-S-0006-03 TaxID=2770775 RepID=UPI001D0C2785|nr:prepilin-type N-terminal cleavage/methylation domain-containing protein [Clostridioides sp. ES-S-0006-03]